jgi:hypothetical protein
MSIADAEAVELDLNALAIFEDTDEENETEML